MAPVGMRDFLIFSNVVLRMVVLSVGMRHHKPATRGSERCVKWHRSPSM